jgi:hypothetical protein
MAVDPRPVTLTAAQIRSVTVRELAQACKAARVRRSEVDALMATAMDDAGDPSETAEAVDLIYALAWQIARRTEPGLTWDDAQTWDVRVEGDMAPDPVDAEADRLRVEASVLTGLPLDQADQITLAELGDYAAVRGGR